MIGGALKKKKTKKLGTQENESKGCHNQAHSVYSDLRIQKVKTLEDIIHISRTSKNWTNELTFIFLETNRELK